MVQGVFPAQPLNPAPGGLLSVAEVVRHASTDGMWANGPFSWDTLSCPASLELADFCSNAARGFIVQSDGGPFTSWPFGVIAAYECNTIGYKPEERREIAKKQAEAGTQKGVEAELWGGYIAQAANQLEVPYLTNNAAVNVGAGAVSVVAGVAKLEQGLADCGFGVEGVLHLTRQAASVASTLGAIRMDDKGVLRTRLGTPVVAGVGYNPATVPAAPANNPIPAPVPLGPQPDNQWGFGTGPVSVHLGPVEFIGEHLDITTNMLTTLAGRTAAVYWDSCCVVAVQMDTTP
jgi:hypothetical protein